jgi:hypothetical protein
MKGWLDKYVEGGELDKNALSGVKNVLSAVGDVTSAPARGLTYLATGKYQDPSEAMGITNPYGAFATDLVLDPMNLVGAGLLKLASGPSKLSKVTKAAGKLSKAADVASTAKNYKSPDIKLDPNKFPGPKNIPINPKQFNQAVKSTLSALTERGQKLDQVTGGKFNVTPDDIHYHGTFAARPIVEVKTPHGSEYFYKSTGWGGKKEVDPGQWQVFGQWMDAPAGTVKPNSVNDWFVKGKGFDQFYGSQSFGNVANSLDNALIKKYNVPPEDLNKFLNFQNMQSDANTFIPKRNNGGWLDKYNDGGPVQENYNDYSVSAGEGFQGDGYSNVGRNYSPAWGGQFQDGGKVPATRSDSVDVYNNSKAVQDYYKKTGYKKIDVKKDSEEYLKKSITDINKLLKRIKKTNYTPQQKKILIKQTNEDLNWFNDQLTELQNYDNPKNYLDNLEGSKKAFEEEGSYNSQKIDSGWGYMDKEGTRHSSKPSLEEYYKSIDSNKFNQREQSYGFLDLRSPMPLYDKRITPQGFAHYKSSANDNVQMYEYDPLAVMPWDMVPVAQQEERIRKFGTSGAPVNILEQHPEWNTAPVTNNTQPTKQSTPQSTIDFMEGNYGQEPITEMPQPQASAYGEVVDPRTGYTHMTRQGSPMYPMVGQNVPEMEEGGPVKRFMQPTETFKNYGYNPKENEMSTEYSTSIGGPGEVYLVPGYRQGKILQYPEEAFNAYGEHLGGPFKTVQAAEDFAQLRHKYVEQNKNIPAPFKTRDYAMGGSIGGATQGIPGATGFMYARTGSIPDNGKYAKKTMASAENGAEMQYYQNGLDWKPRSMAEGGEVVPGENEEVDLPSIWDDKMASIKNTKLRGPGTRTRFLPPQLLDEDQFEVEDVNYDQLSAPHFVNSLTPIESKNYIPKMQDRFPDMETMYYNKNAEFNENWSNLNLLDESSNKIKLNTGRFRGAKVPTNIIDELAKTSRKQNVPLGQLLTLMGRESMFGSGTDRNEDRAGSKTSLMSGWNVAEDYQPYNNIRFLADNKVPGIKPTPTPHGYEYEITDERAMNNYLRKNPKLLDQYKAKLDSTKVLGDQDAFDLAAKFLKKKGVKGYNPGDPNYTNLFNQDYNLLKQDKGLMKYVKQKGYTFEDGGSLELTKLDQLTNFTNYNTKQPGGWLDKYQ